MRHHGAQLALLGLSVLQGAAIRIHPLGDSLDDIVLKDQVKGTKIQTRNPDEIIPQKDEGKVGTEHGTVTLKPGNLTGNASAVQQNVALHGQNGGWLYIYDMPQQFLPDTCGGTWSCEETMYGAEVSIHRILKDSPARTTDPNKAKFFFVPLYLYSLVLAERATVGEGEENRKIAEKWVWKALQHVQAQGLWEKYSRQHVFVFASDSGKCFGGIPELDASISVQFVGDLDAKGSRGEPCYAQGQDIVVPPSPSAACSKAVSSLSSDQGPRGGMKDKLAVFRGANCPAERGCTNAVRSQLFAAFGNGQNPAIQVTDGNPTDCGQYIQEMQAAEFCLCPPGWAKWSGRLVEAIGAGCVPVLFNDRNDLPFGVGSDVAVILDASPQTVGALEETLKANLPKAEQLRQNGKTYAAMFSYTAQNGHALVNAFLEALKKRGGENSGSKTRFVPTGDQKQAPKQG